MPQLHPDIHWLIDYAAGSLPLSHALCVAAHIEHCMICRHKARELSAIGGSLISLGQENVLDDEDALSIDSLTVNEASPLSDELVDSVWAAIDECDPGEAGLQPAPKQAANLATELSSGLNETPLPTCVQKLLPGNSDSNPNSNSDNNPDSNLEKLNWKKLGRSLSVTQLACGDTKREVALHRLRPGRGVANHDHRGQEVTVVLRGSFSDQQGLYLPGDFLVMQAGQAHQPIASGDMECICLSVVDAPIKFTGPLNRLLNPFLKIHPAAA